MSPQGRREGGERQSVASVEAAAFSTVAERAERDFVIKRS
jgi:hypothetical protein